MISRIRILNNCRTCSQAQHYSISNKSNLCPSTTRNTNIQISLPRFYCTESNPLSSSSGSKSGLKGLLDLMSSIEDKQGDKKKFDKTESSGMGDPRPTRYGSFQFRNDPDTFGGQKRERDFNFGYVNTPSSERYGSRPNIVRSSEPLPRVKGKYNPHSDVAKMTSQEVREWRESHAITIQGSIAPNPILEFDHTPFADEVKRVLNASYDKPTTIQSQGWSVALSDMDMVGTARTGSGKTLGFILPAFEHIKIQSPLRPGDGPIALVIVPTRELAQQIEMEGKKYGGPYRAKIACLFGGQGNRGLQLRQLSSQPSLTVATPGRLLDFLNEGVTSLNRVSYLVLDEADQMLDMGFEPQIRDIVSRISPDRQTLMWSATWPNKIVGLAREFFNDPVRINIGSMELSANPNVTQKIIFCDKYSKLDHLVNILQDPIKTLMFVQTKRDCDRVATALIQRFPDANSLRMATMHGDKTQIQRNNILADLKSGVLNLVIATDVAARGLDVTDIGRVINYDMPSTIEPYIHRIGRTARGERKGIAVSFFCSDDYAIASDLAEVIKKARQPVPPELLSFSRGFRSSSPAPTPGSRYGPTGYDDEFSQPRDRGYGQQRDRGYGQQRGGRGPRRGRQEADDDDWQF